MITFTKNMLEHLAGLADPDDRFALDERRNECVFEHAEPTKDEITERRLQRGTHKIIRQGLDEDVTMGQLTRRRVPMHKASAGVREPQSYLTDPQFDDPDFISTKRSLRDIFLGDDDDDDDGFGISPDEFEEDSEEAPDIVHSYGYGHGRQSGRRPGYAARSAGYIVNKSE